MLWQLCYHRSWSKCKRQMIQSDGLFAILRWASCCMIAEQIRQKAFLWWSSSLICFAACFHRSAPICPCESALTGKPFPKIRSTDANGKIIFSMLPVGSYILVETSAPTGYVVDSTPIPIELAKHCRIAYTTLGGILAVSKLD